MACNECTLRKPGSRLEQHWSDHLKFTVVAPGWPHLLVVDITHVRPKSSSLWVLLVLHDSAVLSQGLRVVTHARCDSAHRSFVDLQPQEEPLHNIGLEGTHADVWYMIGITSFFMPFWW